LHDDTDHGWQNYKSSLRLGNDSFERPRKEINSSDNVTNALGTVSKLHNQHNRPRVKSILKSLQSVVPKVCERVDRKESKKRKQNNEKMGFKMSENDESCVKLNQK
jgi:hypothetical protein